jgi:hypothetical protein
VEALVILVVHSCVPPIVITITMKIIEMTVSVSASPSKKASKGRGKIEG